MSESYSYWKEARRDDDDFFLDVFISALLGLAGGGEGAAVERAERPVPSIRFPSSSRSSTAATSGLDCCFRSDGNGMVQTQLRVGAREGTLVSRKKRR